jgi:ABC-type lipoprotein release transport system permease subunit
MSFAWFIARRYLTARRRQAFISLISAVSIVGVGVGVMAVIIALAPVTGGADAIASSDPRLTCVYKTGAART